MKERDSGSASSSPFDVLGVAEIVPLAVFLRVEEHNGRRHEVDHLSGGEEIKVAARVPAPVAVNPIKAGLDGRCGADLVEAVGVEEGGGGEQLDGATADVHADETVFVVKRRIFGAENENGKKARLQLTME